MICQYGVRKMHLRLSIIVLIKYQLNALLISNQTHIYVNNIATINNLIESKLKVYNLFKLKLKYLSVI